MEKMLSRFERFIVLTLMGFMMLAIFFSTIEVGVILIRDLISPPFLLMNVQEIMEVFGFILMVVIGLELLESIKAYLAEHVVHVEVVMLVAIVAVARKVIILDYKETTPMMLLSVASLIISLSVGFFLIRRALNNGPRRGKESKTGQTD